MTRRRGKDRRPHLGPKTDEAAASIVRPERKPSRTAKQHESEIARKTPYGSQRDRRRTS